MGFQHLLIMAVCAALVVESAPAKRQAAGVPDYVLKYGKSVLDFRYHTHTLPRYSSVIVPILKQAMNTNPLQHPSYTSTPKTPTCPQTYKSSSTTPPRASPSPKSRAPPSP